VGTGVEELLEVIQAGVVGVVVADRHPVKEIGRAHRAAPMSLAPSPRYLLPASWSRLCVACVGCGCLVACVCSLCFRWGEVWSRGGWLCSLSGASGLVTGACVWCVVDCAVLQVQNAQTSLMWHHKLKGLWLHHKHRLCFHAILP